MTETPQGDMFIAKITMRGLGTEPEEKVLALGQQPCMVIEPFEDEEHGVIFSLDTTGIIKENAIMVLEALAQTLRETELVKNEEG